MKYSFPAFENGFIRAAAASPTLRVADCTYNADQIIGVMREYAEKNVQLLCLPEFALTGYTCSDLVLAGYPATWGRRRPCRDFEGQRGTERRCPRRPACAP